jgi:hypothetical protein
MEKPVHNVGLCFGPRPHGSAWPNGRNGPTNLAARVRRESIGTVTTCGASALARPPPAARPARGGGAGEVSTRGLRRRRMAWFWGGVLTEVMACRQGGKRRHSAAVSSGRWWAGGALVTPWRQGDGETQRKQRGRRWRWRSPIEEDGGEGGSKSAVPDGGFWRRGGQMATSRRRAGDIVVLPGRCHTVEGKAKEAHDGLAVETEGKKREEAGPAWAHHAEKKRRGGGSGRREGRRGLAEASTQARRTRGRTVRE